MQIMNEWLRLIDYLGLSFEEAKQAMWYKYRSKGKDAFKKFPKAKDIALAKAGEFVALPFTKAIVKYLHPFDLLNSEVNRSSADGEYWALPREIAKDNAIEVYDRNLDLVRSNIIPSDVLLSGLWHHHKMNVVYWAKGNRFHGINYLTGDPIQSSEYPYNIGGYYDKGKSWSRIGGGDGNGPSHNGIIFLTKEAKYGEVVVGKMADDSLDFEQLNTKEWSTPSGLDYGMASWDGTHLILVFNKNQGSSNIIAVDYNGDELLELHPSRGHTDTFPYLLGDRYVSGVTIKLNDRTSKQFGMSTGDNVLILYEKNENGRYEIIERKKFVNGDEGHAPNLGGQVAASGNPQSLILYKNFQYLSDHKNAGGIYHSCTVDVSLKEGDNEPRLIYVNGCLDGTVGKQAEGQPSSDGKTGALKANSDGGGKGALLGVINDERLAKPIRDRLFGGEFDSNPEQIRELIVSGEVLPPYEGEIIDPILPVIDPVEPVIDPIDQSDIFAHIGNVNTLKQENEDLKAQIAAFQEKISNAKSVLE